MGKRTLCFCGAFQGRIPMRRGESAEDARARAEALILAALDRVKSFRDINAGVDADTSIEEE